jgi:hypothetical protein
VPLSLGLRTRNFFEVLILPRHIKGNVL